MTYGLVACVCTNFVPTIGSMPLKIYRRHSSDCPHLGQPYWRSCSKRNKPPCIHEGKCECSLWIRGSHEGVPVKESLKTNSWDRADRKSTRLNSSHRCIS